jgi:hypothetical protein
MKVVINMYSNLVITPETETEVEALKLWNCTNIHTSPSIHLNETHFYRGSGVVITPINTLEKTRSV